MAYITLGEIYHDPMADGDSIQNVFTTETNRTVVSKVRPALNLDQLAEEIRLLEALPRIASQPRAKALYYRVRDRLDDPWLARRLLALIR